MTRVTVPYEERLARYEEMTALRVQGMTLAEIANRYGLVRERVRQILKAPPHPAIGRPRGSTKQKEH